MRPNIKPLSERTLSSDKCYLWIDDPAFDDYLARKESDVLQSGTLQNDGTFVPCSHHDLGAKIKVFLTNIGNAKDVCHIYSINPFSEKAAIYDENLNPLGAEDLKHVKKLSLYESEMIDDEIERYYSDPDYVPGIDDDEDEDKIMSALKALDDTDADIVYEALDKLRSGESLSGIEQDEAIGILAQYKDSEQAKFLKNFIEYKNTSEYNDLGEDMRTGRPFHESVAFIYGLKANLKECDKLSNEDKYRVCKECEDTLEETTVSNMKAEAKAELREAALYCLTYLRG